MADPYNMKSDNWLFIIVGCLVAICVFTIVALLIYYDKWIWLGIILGCIIIFMLLLGLTDWSHSKR